MSFFIETIRTRGLPFVTAIDPPPTVQQGHASLLLLSAYSHHPSSDIKAVMGSLQRNPEA
jgi:hypothetical protein